MFHTTKEEADAADAASSTVKVNTTVGQTVDAILASIGNSVSAVTQYLKDHANTDPAVAQALRNSATTEEDPDVIKATKGLDGNTYTSKSALDAANAAWKSAHPYADESYANFLVDVRVPKDMRNADGYYKLSGKIATDMDIQQATANQAAETARVTAAGEVTSGNEILDRANPNVKTAQDYLSGFLGKMVDNPNFDSSQPESATNKKQIWQNYTLEDLLRQGQQYGIGSAQSAAAVETQRERSMGLNAGQAGIGGGSVIMEGYQKGIDLVNQTRASGLASGTAALQGALSDLGVGIDLLKAGSQGQISLADLSQSGKQFFAGLEQNQAQFLATLEQTKAQLSADAWGNFWKTIAGMVPYVGPWLKTWLDSNK